MTDFAFIGLNRPIYRSGETLEGVAIIVSQGQFSKKLTASVDIRIIGRETLVWHDYSPVQDVTTTQKGSTGKVFLDQTISIWRRGDDRKDPLAELGTHSFHFDYVLPPFLPGSFSLNSSSSLPSSSTTTSSSSSSSSAEASAEEVVASSEEDQVLLSTHTEMVIRRPLATPKQASTWIIPNGTILPRKIDSATSIEYCVFLLVTIADLSARAVVLKNRANFRVAENVHHGILYKDPLTYSSTKTFLFGGGRPAELRVTTKCVHWLESFIPLHVDLTNGSSRQINCISVHLYQRIGYRIPDSSQPLIQTCSLASYIVPDSAIAAHGNFVRDVCIRPPTPATWNSGYDYCGTSVIGNLINVTYHIIVKLEVSNALDLEVLIPIHLVQRTSTVQSLKDCLHEPLESFSSDALPVSKPFPSLPAVASSSSAAADPVVSEASTKVANSASNEGESEQSAIALN